MIEGETNERIGQLAQEVMDEVEADGAGTLTALCLVYEVSHPNGEITYGACNEGTLIRRDLVGLLEMGKKALLDPDREDD